MEFVRLAHVAEVPSGEGRVFASAGFRALLTRVGDTIHALQPTCPHKGCQWDGAKVEGDIVQCPHCRFRYSVSTGLNPLTTYCHVNQSTAEYHYRRFPERHAAVFDVRSADDDIAVATSPRPFRKVLS
jgi:nitrite reductase/ring-hydroxylating ferredoxin subunit